MTNQNPPHGDQGIFGDLGLGAKELLLGVPALATALAVTYDVGYFYGIGIEYFTFFSLSEHIVFALEALSFALMAILYVLVLSTGIVYGSHKGAADAQRIIASGEYLNPEYKPGPTRREKIISAGLHVWMALTAVWLFYFQQYTLGILNTAILVFNLCLPILFRKIRAVQILFFGFSLTVAMAMSLALGYEMSQKLIAKTTVTHIANVENSEVGGALIRAGERGVLFYNIASKQVEFLRTDLVKWVKTKPSQ